MFAILSQNFHHFYVCVFKSQYRLFRVLDEHNHLKHLTHIGSYKIIIQSLMRKWGSEVTQIPANIKPFVRIRVRIFFQTESFTGDKEKFDGILFV